MSYRPLETLESQVAVVTGAMGGIGWATASRLARRGARVIGIVRRDVEQAQQRMDQLSDGQVKHMALLADVTDRDQMKRVVDQVTAATGRCDILVNTAGKTQPIPHRYIDLITDDFFEEITRLNLRSYYTVIREFLPLMRRHPEALIVNIGSASSQTPGFGSNMAYAAAKAGLDNLTRNLSRVLAPDIRVVGVSPGKLNYQMSQLTGPTAVTERVTPENLDDFYRRVAENTPLRRVTEADDVASTIEGLVTLLRFMTGCVISVDGGKTC